MQISWNLHAIVALWNGETIQREVLFSKWDHSEAAGLAKFARYKLLYLSTEDFKCKNLMNLRCKVEW